MSPYAADPTLPCMLTADPATPCRLGAYPIYAVNASTVRHMQHAVRFARAKNIRLVVKNTGHDFLGRSAGAHALSIWTHHLKDIQFMREYVGHDYVGAAFKVGTGVQVEQLYEAARDNGVIVVGAIGRVRRAFFFDSHSLMLYIRPSAGQVDTFRAVATRL